MLLFRAMNDKEANDTLKYNALQWNSKFKWFGTYSFVTSRVQDGKFNNSKFVEGRYKRLLKFEFSDKSLAYFSKCGYNEFMLCTKECPMVRLLSIEEVQIQL